MPADRDLPSGRSLGRFEVEDLLGEGGSGTVYEARDGDRRVALKVLRTELSLSDREMGRFFDEARRMVRVEHPGLVRLLEAGCLPDGRPFLAMPLLRGRTLADHVRDGPLPPAQAVRVFGVLARAVGALHAAGIVHRDIKPENVLLVDDAAGLRPVLLDFGIARDLDAADSTTTAAGRIRGTPAYMAPERFFGTPASVRSDVYELGVTLFAMLTGKLPWGPKGDAGDRLAPRGPSELGIAVPPALSQAIVRALSTRPENRPASAEAFADEVEQTWERGAAPLTTHTTEAIDAVGAGGPDAFGPTLIDVTRSPEREVPHATLSLQGTVETRNDVQKRVGSGSRKAALALGGLALVGLSAGVSWSLARARPERAEPPHDGAVVVSARPELQAPAVPTVAASSADVVPSPAASTPVASRGEPPPRADPPPAASSARRPPRAAASAASRPVPAAPASPKRNDELLLEDRR